jgi:hypothetical protein
LLILLIFGWAMHLAPAVAWPSGDFLIATTARHV